MSFKLGKRRLKKYNPEFKESCPGVDKAMIKFFGTEVTVIEVTSSSLLINGLVYIQEDTREWSWHTDWFEPETEWGFGV